MYYRIYDLATLTTQYTDDLGNLYDDIGDEPFEDVPSADEAVAMVRTERNARLSACDWTQLADVNLTADCKAAFTAYRQALRDADMLNPVWPDVPAEEWAA